MQSEETSIKDDKRALAKIGEQAIVRCEKFRCLAKLDEEGKWRNVFSGSDLPAVLEIVLRF
jgi:hypothetical protein